jgi:hypothetical protein
MNDAKHNPKDAPRGLSGAKLETSLAVAKRVMAASQSPTVSVDSPGPRFARAVETLRKYGVKP